MKKFATKKCGSFNELEIAANEFSRALTHSQRLDAAQYLREQHYLIKGLEHKRIDKNKTKIGNFK